MWLFYARKPVGFHFVLVALNAFAPLLDFPQLILQDNVKEWVNANASGEILPWLLHPITTRVLRT